MQMARREVLELVGLWLVWMTLLFHVFISFSSSRETAGNNPKHVKRKWGVTNKIKLNLSGFFFFCSVWGTVASNTEMSRHKLRPRGICNLFKEELRSKTTTKYTRVHAKYGKLHMKGRGKVLWGWKARAFPYPRGAGNEMDQETLVCLRSRPVVLMYVDVSYISTTWRTVAALGRFRPTAVCSDMNVHRSPWCLPFSRLVT